MKIRYIRAKNFLSFKDVEIPLDKDLDIIVGPNNSGKTNVARALKLVADIIDGRTDYEFTAFLHDQNKKYFRLEIGYELSKEEKQDIERFSGEYVLISGKMKTAAKVWTKNSNEKYIWLDEVIAENAGIGIGDYVEVEKI